MALTGSCEEHEKSHLAAPSDLEKHGSKILYVKFLLKEKVWQWEWKREREAEREAESFFYNEGISGYMSMKQVNTIKHCDLKFSNKQIKNSRNYEQAA